jgi:endonuclease VIII
MPEGPEIRRAADAVADIIEGVTIKEIWFAHQHLKSFESELVGCKVRRVETRGKAMITQLNNRYAIYSHNQLYGRWFCTHHKEQVQTDRSLRLSITTSRGEAKLYSASEIAVLTQKELSSHPLLSRMGPDVLNHELTTKHVTKILRDSKFCNRQLGALLTDQAFVAGLGNYLRCEILFLCGLHPKRHPKDCDDEIIHQLAEQVIYLPRQSYANNSITNDLKVAKRLIKSGRSFEESRFHIFRRDGLPCYRCQTQIIKIKGGQPCYLCPTCQPTP